MRGTCEAMCSEYEREAREFKHEVNIFEAVNFSHDADPVHG